MIAQKINNATFLLLYSVKSATEAFVFGIVVSLEKVKKKVSDK